MLNDWIRPSCQIELNSLRVVNSDLVRLQMDQAVDGFVYETSSTDTSDIDANILHVFHVNALNAKWKNHDAVFKILHNDVLFALIFGSRSHDILIVLQIFYQQVIANVDYIDCGHWVRLLLFCS